MSKQRIYHGWLEVEKGGAGFKDYFICRDRSKNGEVAVLATFRSAVDAIAFWDARVGKRVSLQDTPLGAYRVFTEEET